MRALVLAAVAAVALGGAALAGTPAGAEGLNDTLEGRKSKAYKAEVRAGATITVTLESKNCDQLVLVVMDDKGKVLEFGKGGQESKTAKFTSGAGGTYYLGVKNLSGRAVDFFISHD